MDPVWRTRAGTKAATAIYSGLEAVYPIMVVEGVWSLIALRRFLQRAEAARVATG